MIILYDVYIYCCKNQRQAMVIPVWLTQLLDADFTKEM